MSPWLFASFTLSNLRSTPLAMPMTLVLSNIEFTLGDIVRSGMVKEYLISKIKKEQENG